MGFNGLAHFLKVYLFEMGEGQRKSILKQTPCTEPNVGLGPRTPVSHPELKADTQPLSHSGAPEKIILKVS